MAGTTPIYGLPYPQSSDLVSAYPALGQDLAEDLDGILAAKSDYAMPKNAQTGTTYTFVLADAAKLVTASNAASSTYTIPPQSSVAWAADTILRVVNYGAGTVTFAGGSGVTVTNTAATLAQYASCALVRTGSDAWTVVPFSGGGASRAVYQSSTGSPTITTVGTSTCLKFTGTGTFTTSKAGLADILVVGGGGGGGVRNGSGGGGGGAGGYVYLTNQYIPAGTYTATVGGGGSGVSGDTSGGDGSPSSVTTQTNVRAYGGGGGGASGGGSGKFGGSGGGGPHTNGGPGSGLAGQGNSGGSGNGSVGGGGGGSSAAGATAGAGGAGTANSITGSSVTYAKGGDNGSGGGSGTANTGNGGNSSFSTSGSGGSGVVIVLL